MIQNSLADKVVLVTGAARRIGAAIVTRLHASGACVAIHFRGSADAAGTGAGGEAEATEAAREARRRADRARDDADPAGLEADQLDS